MQQPQFHIQKTFEQGHYFWGTYAVSLLMLAVLVVFYVACRDVKQRD